jgi:hypothetical protein
VVKHNANVFHGRGIKRPEILAGANWSVTAGTVTDYSTQLSGVFLEEAAAVSDYPMVYRDVNYMGRWSSLPPGSYTTAQLAARGVADNDITAMTVLPGWTVTLYENDNFGGASLVRTTNDTFLSGGTWNDRVSSLVVAAPPGPTNIATTVYQNCDFTGWSVGLPLGNWDILAMQDQGLPNDDASSVQVAANRRVTLYNDAGFAGTSVVLTATDNCLADNGLNDLASSLRVEAIATATATPRPTATFTARPTATFTARPTATATARSTATATTRPRATATNPPAGCAIGATCEAETAALGGGVVASALHAGYTGSGFADYQGNGTGFVEWTVNVPTAGTYNLNVRYANGGTGDRPMSIQVNGTTVVSSLSFPVTGWTSWTVRTQSVSLPAGTVRIRATELPNGPNVDNLVVTSIGPTPTATATLTPTPRPRATPTIPPAGCAIGATCEAETAALGGGVLASALHAGYTGSGFADYQGSGTGFVEWTVSVATAGTYTLNIRYANGGTGDRPMSIQVNGTTVVSSLSFPVTGWTSWTVRTQSISLPAGSVRIRATELPNGPNVDNLVVTSTGAAPAWAPGIAYAVGNLVTYGGATYRCAQAHTSQVGWEPPNAASLWTLQ